MFEWDAPDQNVPPKSTKTAFPSPNYRIAKKVLNQIHDNIISELIV